MGWAIMFLVLIALVIILSISLINWKIQIYKVIVQLNAILNRKTKKLVTVSLSDRRLEHLVEIINQIVSKDNIYLGEIQKKENELKENISCLSHDLRTPLTSIRGYLQLLSSAPDEKSNPWIMPKTSSKKFRQKVKEIKIWLYNNKEQKLGKLMYMLNVKLVGHYRYYGISFNSRMISNYKQQVRELLYKVLNRRSEKKSYTREGFIEMMKYYKLVKPKIYYSLFC